MQKKQTLVSSEKFSIRAHCWCLVNTLFIGLLWIFIGLQALGMRQLIASEVALKEHARSVVLIDSAVAFSIPKSELVGSQIK